MILEGAGYKISYGTLDNLVQKIRVELDKIKVKEKKLTDEIIEIKRKRKFLENVIKVYAGRSSETSKIA